jgi:hypothetical protein
MSSKDLIRLAEAALIPAATVDSQKKRSVRLSESILSRLADGGKPTMLSLQREQFEHDERFHREIARLDMMARLRHMALHYCKYTGQLAMVCETGDEDLRRKTITDTFIITLCSANTLNLNLSAHLDCSDTYTLRDLAAYITHARCSQATIDDHWIFHHHAIYSAKIARACEKIDHLEDYNYRGELQEAVVRLCETALVAATTYNIDLVDSVARRRREVRNRNPLISSVVADAT